MLVKNIVVVTQHYYYGPVESDGILSLETYNGKADGLDISDLFRQEFVQPQQAKIPYEPEYDGEDLSRIPDFRTQLLWKPHIHLKAGATETLTFFTGDVDGTYSAEVVGITASGKALYYRTDFAVKTR
jgi:hypothetical protein